MTLQSHAATAKMAKANRDKKAEQLRFEVRRGFEPRSPVTNELLSSLIASMATDSREKVNMRKAWQAWRKLSPEEQKKYNDEATASRARAIFQLHYHGC